jgi:hypothetical protein
VAEWNGGVPDHTVLLFEAVWSGTPERSGTARTPQLTATFRQQQGRTAPGCPGAVLSWVCPAAVRPVCAGPGRSPGYRMAIHARPRDAVRHHAGGGRVTIRVDCEEAGVVDRELSRAVVVYLRGSGLAWPSASPEAVAAELGAEAAERLMPRLRQLANEAVYWPVDWQNHIDDLGGAMRVVEDEISAAYPELDQDAISALGWQFAFCNKLKVHCHLNGEQPPGRPAGRFRPAAPACGPRVRCCRCLRSSGGGCGH